MNYATYKNISELQIGEPLYFKNLTMFGLKGVDFSTIKYQTFQQASREHQYKISEINNEGHVPQLHFTNLSNIPILILDGTELVGAKQNRVLNTSILAPANQMISIPVSCCERSRWSYTSSRDFTFQNQSMYASARFDKVKSVNEKWTMDGYAESDQSEVWSNIASKSKRMNVHSASESMGDFYHTYRDQIEEYVGMYKAESNDLGICAAIGDQIVLLEIFDSNITFAENLSMIIRSLAADAMEIRTHGSIPNKKNIKKFIDQFLSSEFKKLGKIGIAEQIKISHSDQIGQGLFYKSNFIHSFQFNNHFKRNF